VHILGLATVLGALFTVACGSQVSSAGSTGGYTAGGSTGGWFATGGSGGGAVGADAQLATDATNPCRPSPPCPSASWYVYRDTLCPYPNTGQTQHCSSNGDGLCYQDCSTKADCRDPLFPNCGAITVFGGSDFGQDRKVCTPTSALPACRSSSAGGTGGALLGGASGN
jgi:hypothetical protein